MSGAVDGNSFAGVVIAVVLLALLLYGSDHLKGVTDAPTRE
ncbi:hypothetical protein [Paenalkalicoccus suaedae]|nr:hypothetical protein [Paenalkalicoccus suaedae]